VEDGAVLGPGDAAVGPEDDLELGLVFEVGDLRVGRAEVDAPAGRAGVPLTLEGRAPDVPAGKTQRALWRLGVEQLGLGMPLVPIAATDGAERAVPRLPALPAGVPERVVEAGAEGAAPRVPLGAAPFL